MTCRVCTKTTELQRCSRCKSATYCSKEHQAADWPRHKRECTQADELADVVAIIMKAFLEEMPRWSCTHLPLGAPLVHKESKTTLIYFNRTPQSNPYSSLQEMLHIQSVTLVSTCGIVE